MKIQFTHHAILRAKQRNISESQIIKTITESDLISLEDENENKLAYYRTYKSTLSIKVVAIRDQDGIRVITVHPVKKNQISKVIPFIDNS